MGENVCTIRALSGCVLEVVKPDEGVVRPSLNVRHSLQIHLLLLAHFVFEGGVAGVDAVHAAALTHRRSRRQFADDGRWMVDGGIRVGGRLGWSYERVGGIY